MGCGFVTFIVLSLESSSASTILPVALIIIGGLLTSIARSIEFAVAIRFGRKYVVTGINQGALTQRRIGAGIAPLFYLRHIQYIGNLPAADVNQITAPILGYAKSDYIPTGYDRVSLLAFLIGWFSIIFVIAPVPLVLGIIGLVRIKHHPERKGRARAWFAIICGAIWTIVLALFLIDVIFLNPGK
jgi:hypothetical protein